ncbi:MAG: L-glutamate gamma-semialdehyde dehydrogenase [Firmicutes bacterium]|nr:L-glutamate gamma-semialdehyde dehydrogenase [Bacillota bacterium]
MLPPFVNEPFTDFTVEANRDLMRQAIAAVEAELGKEYPLEIGAEQIFTKEKIVSTNPSEHQQVIGVTAKADRDLAGQAVEAAKLAFESWQHVAVDARARYLVKAAAEMRRRKYEFAAWMVLEIGKNWAEADADVAEAIDFMEYYAREMLRLSEPMKLTPWPGEENWATYIPLGVGAVIPPWNFPLAILVGMTTGAIVAGNTVVLKPASNTITIAAKFMELLRDVSLPAGVVNFVPGGGGEIGDFLVDHPDIRFINFTGSKEVGLRISERAAKVSPGQKWIKRVHAEMGGKDTLVVDKDCDLDAAVQATVASAFGFQGQKCSACSRVVVLKEIYDQFCDKLVAAAKEIKPGSVKDGDYLGPVCDGKAHKTILEYIETGKNEGRLLLGGNPGPATGWFIEPTIIADVAPNAVISQEEIFGPVLAVLKADSFADAIAIANNTEFGLTGGVFSNNREHLEYARREFFVGNLYFNRKITGALVGVQPFGGYNMSGTCAKAGGPDYLLLFTQMKVVVEKY